jgi:hypothetical protein
MLRQPFFTSAACRLVNRPLIIFSVLCLNFSSLASAEVYSWKDKSGNTVYSDQKPSAHAQPSPPSSQVNYYDAETATKDSHTAEPAALNAEIAQTPKDSEPKTQRLSEQQCQQQYRRSCDEVYNWQQYAREACGNDSRCADEDYLERKYRPHSNEELLAVAHRAAARNNMMDKKIAQYLSKKYSNYCKNQATMYCHNNRSNQCKQQLLSYCKDPRGLDEIFERYDNLSNAEKQAIIDKAKAMAVARGDNQLDYDQVVASLIDLLISEAMMGI